jgi:DNA-binding NarL/FixJ family response regulator
VLAATQPWVRERGTIAIEVSSVVVRLALLHVTEEVGWCPCRHPAPCPCVRVTDDAVRSGPAPILVVRDRAAECLEALRALTDGRVRALVLWDEPETLVAALEALGHDACLVPRRVIELAASAPRLSHRQRATLRMLALGRSNRLIASAQQQSLSTAKRDIAELFDLFDVTNRAALTSAASSLGFV